MPRPRKEQSTLDDAIRHAAEAGFEPPFVPGSPRPQMRAPSVPVKTEDGKFNADWFAEILSNLHEYQTQFWNYWGKSWPDYRDQVDTIIKQATTCGIDLARYAPEQFTLSQIQSVDDLMAATDSMLEKLEEQLQSCTLRALQLVPDAKKKSWLSVLRRTRRAHRLCRDSIPTDVVEANPGRDDVFEAWALTRSLRFMLWCQRTTIGTTDGTESLVMLPDHLLVAGVTIALARQMRHAGADIQGVVVTIGPRHGKSWLVCADEALSLSEDPWNPHGFVHRKREIAQQRVSMVKDWFDEEKGLGRRRAALFPRVRIDAAKSRGKGSLWLLLDGESVCTHAEGNLAAHGIHSGAQGITLTEIKFDDPVDEKDRNEAGTRERTNAAFQQTWLNRLTGRKSFFVMVATCWHPDDVTGSLVKMVRAGAIRAAVVNIPCGGPHDGFRPLWPEVGYDSEFLRRRFMRLGAPAYSCIYQNEPDTIEGRRISKLHFFDQRMIDDKSARTPEWSRFLDDPATLRFLSIDPSGSGARTSNKAGIGYFAFGEMRTTDENGATAVLPRLVMLRAWSIHASQHALVDVVVKFIASGQRVDRILVETTGGYHATAEQLVREGIPSATVWRVAPGTGTKVDRLLKYAIHVENGDIAFPGRWTTDEHGDPTLEISPEFASVGEQLLRAGTTVDDEQLDVVRQALSQHSMEFDAAHGWTQARGSGRATGDPMSDGISKLFAAATSRPDRSSRSAMSFITRKQAFR